MKRILIATAALAFIAAPAFAQSTDGGSTSGAIIMPETNATGTTGTGQDNMGSAARTGDTVAPAGTMGEGTDNMSTSSTTGETSSTIPTQGMDAAGAATASDSTPSNGIVPGQSSK